MWPPRSPPSLFFLSADGAGRKTIRDLMGVAFFFLERRTARSPSPFRWSVISYPSPFFLDHGKGESCPSAGRDRFSYYFCSEQQRLCLPFLPPSATMFVPPPRGSSTRGSSFFWAWKVRCDEPVPLPFPPERCPFLLFSPPF